MSHTFTLHGHSFIAHASRALEWPACQTLFIADLHLGKAATFRSHGIALPEGSSAADLRRLSAQLFSSQAKRLVILGDFFHAKSGRTPALTTLFLAFRKRHPDVAMVLVRGNHDLHAGPPPADWDVSTQTEAFIENGLVGCHAPDDAPRDAPWVAGHIHPVAWLGTARERVRLPCFWVQRGGIVLPAFTAFAGGQSIPFAASEHRLGIAGPNVMRLPANA